VTLDELLALLPDNSTGEIDADDLRTVTSALWERAWPAPGEMLYNLRQDSTPLPLAGEASCDQGWGNSNLLIFNSTDLRGVDQGSWLINLDVGARIWLYATDPNAGSGIGRVIFTVAGDPQFGTNNIGVPVTSSGATGAADEWTQATFRFDQAPLEPEPVLVAPSRVGLWAYSGSAPAGNGQFQPVPDGTAVDNVTMLRIAVNDIAGTSFDALFRANPAAVYMESSQDPNATVGFKTGPTSVAGGYFELPVTALLAAGGSGDMTAWGTCRVEFL
jgi:hypothetical protein